MSDTTLNATRYDALDQEHHEEASQLVDTLEAACGAPEAPAKKNFAAFYGERRHELLAMLGVALSMQAFKCSDADAEVREATNNPLLRKEFIVLFAKAELALDKNSPFLTETRYARYTMNRLFWWSDTSVRSLDNEETRYPFALTPAKAKELMDAGEL